MSCKPFTPPNDALVNTVVYGTMAFPFVTGFTAFAARGNSHVRKGVEAFYSSKARLAVATALLVTDMAGMYWDVSRFSGKGLCLLGMPCNANAVLAGTIATVSDFYAVKVIVDEIWSPGTDESFVRKDIAFASLFLLLGGMAAMFAVQDAGFGLSEEEEDAAAATRKPPVGWLDAHWRGIIATAVMFFDMTAITQAILQSSEDLADQGFLRNMLMTPKMVWRAVVDPKAAMPLAAVAKDVRPKWWRHPVAALKAKAVDKVKEAVGPGEYTQRNMATAGKILNAIALVLPFIADSSNAIGQFSEDPAEVYGLKDPCFN